jgi:hypothetical protein
MFEIRTAHGFGFMALGLHQHFKTDIKTLFAVELQVGENLTSCKGPVVLNGSSASSVTTHGEMTEPKLFDKNGPSGTYSHFWISRADKSLKITIPKM